MRATTAWSSVSVIAWMRERLVAAGGDPGEIADEPFSFWRLPEVERRSGLSRPTIYRLAAKGKFPRPIAFSGTRPERAQEGAAA